MAKKTKGSRRASLVGCKQHYTYRCGRHRVTFEAGCPSLSHDDEWEFDVVSVYVEKRGELVLELQHAIELASNLRMIGWGVGEHVRLGSWLDKAIDKAYAMFIADLRNDLL